MAFLRNDAINRVNLHTGIQALAQSGGGVFFLVFLVRYGVPIPTVLLALAGINAARLALRPLILPLVRRWGVKPLLIAGTIILAAQYPILPEIHGVGWALAALCAVSAVGEIFYFPAYHTYFATLGDAEHRGHQIGAREALVAMVGVVAPLLGAWGLVTLGPRALFDSAAAIQVLAVLPLIGAPNVAVKAAAPGAFHAARLGAILQAADGWFDSYFIFVWQIALFLALGESFAVYGGAMALAGLVGAASGLLLGRHVDAGHGVRAVTIAYGGMATIVLLRAASLDWPLLAVAANALGALLGTLMLPAGTAISNLAKASPCPMRFHIVTEGGWDAGCVVACLIAAALCASGVSLSLVILVALPPLAIASNLLRRHYAAQRA